MSLGYHKSQPQGDAIYRLSYDTSGFQTILTVLVNSIVVSTVTLIFMTWIMLSMNWALTLITLSVAPLLLWVTKLFAGPLKKRWLEAKEVDMRLTTVIQRSVASIDLVQAFGARLRNLIGSTIRPRTAFAPMSVRRGRIHITGCWWGRFSAWDMPPSLDMAVGWRHARPSGGRMTY